MAFAKIRSEDAHSQDGHKKNCLAEPKTDFLKMSRKQLFYSRTDFLNTVHFHQMGSLSALITKIKFWNCLRHLMKLKVDYSKKS